MKYFVHIYHTVRSKFAVEADSHEAAMKAADELFSNSEQPIETESAEEVTGYLVDEEGDTGYDRTVTYDESGQPDAGMRKHAISGPERDTILAALRHWQNKEFACGELDEIATNDGAHPALSDEAIDDLCERINV